MIDRFNHLITEGTGKILTAGRAVVYAHPGAKIELNASLSLGHNLPEGSLAETYLKLREGALLTVNGYFKAFCGASVEIFPNGKLTLGGGYINSGCVISCAHDITIGEGAAIARGVYIYDSDHHALLDNAGAQTNPPATVIIGRRVWIGVAAVILKGVTIGDGAVIAAGAVVTKSVPARCLAAGNPAQVIRYNVDWR